MSMIIAHNMSALNTKRQFGSSARGMSSSMEKLSSGFKINTGKDDPSGLLISEKLRSQLQGYLRAKQNTEEAMNVMGIAEGALNEMNDILKKMKSLATHAANNGVTSKDQIAADQAELDSGIQTIDRIAQTTQYARDNILNGAKEIAFDATTGVKGTQQNSLVNVRDSSFDQIFKRDGYSVSISFSGGSGNIVPGAEGYGSVRDARGNVVNDVEHPGSNLTGDSKGVNFSMQASKAYLEIDTATPNTALPGGGFPAAQIKNGLFTQEQVFTLTGTTGSRQFTFSKGSSVTSLVKDIHAAVGATGVDASLIFNSNQKIDAMVEDVNLDSLATGNAVRTNNEATVFGSHRDEETGAVDAGISSVGGLQGIQWGRNTDGQGRIYVKYITDTEVELYKDSSMSAESKVATGRIDYPVPNPLGLPGSCDFVGVNNSGLSGSMMITNNAKPDVNLPDVRGNYICTGGIEGNNVGWDGQAAISWSGSTTNMPGEDVQPGVMAFDGNLTAVTGIELGKNTNEEGKIFLKTVCDENGMVTVYAYRDERMSAADLVAKSAPYLITHAGPLTVVLDEVRDSNNSNGTGLGIVLSVNDLTEHPFLDANGDPVEGTVTGNMTFNHLGARIYSTEYGSDSYLKITQDKGSIFSSYETPGSTDRTMIDAGELGTTKLIYGQDATIAVNGTQVKTNGLNLNMATQDIQARFTFNAGKVGSTTLAQVGYDVGSPFTKVGALNLGLNAANTDGLSAYLCNAGHATNEVLGNFQGGMQLQLGEGAGDQNRTVVSLKSMTTENLGRIIRGGYWDSAHPTVWSEKQFTLKDCFGGGTASLSADPTLTMAVIDQAIDDISQQRALIGAMQANLLQTNANNLDVTFENVTKTESGIRDADMATEMSEFTKFQVLQSAGISMMAQANQRSQQVLQLLQ